MRSTPRTARAVARNNPRGFPNRCRKDGVDMVFCVALIAPLPQRRGRGQTGHRSSLRLSCVCQRRKRDGTNKQHFLLPEPLQKSEMRGNKQVKNRFRESRHFPQRAQGESKCLKCHRDQNLIAHNAGLAPMFGPNWNSQESGHNQT